MSSNTNAPTPRGPEDEPAGDDEGSPTSAKPRSDERDGKDRRAAPPPPLDKPATPDANPIDPRVFERHW